MCEFFGRLNSPSSARSSSNELGVRVGGVGGEGRGRDLLEGFRGWGRRRLEEGGFIARRRG